MIIGVNTKTSERTVNVTVRVWVRHLDGVDIQDELMSVEAVVGRVQNRVMLTQPGVNSRCGSRNAEDRQEIKAHLLAM